MDKIIHKDSAAAQPRIFPIGVKVPVSEKAQELLNDFRDAACKFGTETVNVEDNYVAMQMRFSEVAKYLGFTEKAAGISRDVVMKF